MIFLNGLSLLSTDPGDIVFDPFGGGGSTYQVAEKTNRLWIGSEIGPCEPIAERLQFLVNVRFGDPCPDELTNCFKRNDTL